MMLEESTSFSLQCGVLFVTFFSLLHVELETHLLRINGLGIENS